MTRLDWITTIAYVVVSLSAFLQGNELWTAVGLLGALIVVRTAR